MGDTASSAGRRAAGRRRARRTPPRPESMPVPTLGPHATLAARGRQLHRVGVPVDIAERASSEPLDRSGDLSPEDIEPGVADAIREADALVAEAVALPADATFDAVFGRLDRAGRVMSR